MRLSAFLGSPRPLVQGKAALLVPAWEEIGMEAAEPLVRLFEMSFRYLGLRFLDRLLVNAAGPKGIVRDMPGVLDKAREVGRRLAVAESGW